MTEYHVYVDGVLVHKVTEHIENTIGEIVRNQLENNPTSIFIHKIVKGDIGTI